MTLIIDTCAWMDDIRKFSKSRAFIVTQIYSVLGRATQWLALNMLLSSQVSLAFKVGHLFSLTTK